MELNIGPGDASRYMHEVHIERGTTGDLSGDDLLAMYLNASVLLMIARNRDRNNESWQVESRAETVQSEAARLLAMYRVPKGIPKLVALQLTTNYFALACEAKGMFESDSDCHDLEVGLFMHFAVATLDTDFDPKPHIQRYKARRVQ